MSWLLFLDESGHDHKNMPYEVRGGVAIQDVPTPLFVSSDMAYPIQAADLCIYCVNWSFRLPTQGMNAPRRDDIAHEFGPWLEHLQYRGQGYKDGKVFDTWGITYVPNPYAPGRT